MPKSGLNLYNPLKLFETIKPLVFEKFKKYPSMKQQITYECLMKKRDLVTKEEETDNSHFHSEQQKIYEGSNFDEIYKIMVNKIIESFETYSNNSSQWVFEEGSKIILNINNIKLLKGSSWIPLPSFLKKKKAIINPKNYDQKCFLWCIAIHKLLKTNPNFKHPERISNILKKKAEKYDLKGVNFPCEFSDIDKFEKNNNISINVLAFDGEFFIKRETKKRHSTHVNLLLFEENGTSHYCLIKNKSRLLSSEKSKHDGKEFFCDYCFQGFTNEELLTSHSEYCKNHKFIKTYFPKKGETLKFINFERMHDVPFITYADLECCLEPIDSQIGDNTKQFQKHEPSGYCYMIKCFDDTLFKPILRRYTRKSANEDVALKFMKSLERDYRKIYKKFKFPKKDFYERRRCKRF